MVTVQTKAEEALWWSNTIEGYDHRANENGRLRDLERNSQSHRAHSSESKRLRDSVLWRYHVAVFTRQQRCTQPVLTFTR